MEVTGHVYKILDIQEFDSGFRKRELILTTAEQYPQTLAIEFVQERINLLNDIKTGDSVKISINLRGREWTAPDGKVRYFNTIQGWRIENLDAAKATAAPPEPAGENADLTRDEEEEDDLPF
ncbi:MAG: DUF3127 domain-containing protein [Flavobacteriales bacterium]